MSTINVLPASTAKLLTATQVITSPLSTLKELLENALDARATSIAIEISSNTVDVLQVRDNGHGIQPQDRSICCKKHTTSKLAGVQDLATIGGNSLGFRGEALFAIAQVVDGMDVTTRVEGESTAVHMSIDREGEVTGRTVASAATGTTIRVTDMFGKLPVRKQAAEKDASKCLAEIKKLLQAFALARPHVRLQLRVLKAKSDKMNFSYAPKIGSEASVRDAAWKVIGSEPASQCTFYVLGVGPFTIQGFLPTPDAVVAKISNTGHFVSIDQRPVSTTRGTPRQMLKLIVEKMRASGDALASVKDPFFVLNVVCSRGSYDPNVEPAKDDVLFHDASVVLKTVEELLSAVYLRPVLKDVVPKVAVEARSKIQDSETTAAEHGLPPDRLLEDSADEAEDEDGDEQENITCRTKPETASMAVSEQHAFNDEDSLEYDAALLEEPVANTNELEVLEKRANVWRSDMYGLDDDDLDLFEMAQQERERPASADAESLQMEKNDLNPWTITKLNAPQKLRQTAAAVPMIRSVMRAQSLSPVPCRLQPVSTNKRRTPMINDDMQSVQSSQHNQDSGHLAFLDSQFPASDRGRGAIPTGLLTPMPSSSPVRHLPQKQTTVQWSVWQKQANQNLNKAFKSPVPLVEADANSIYVARPKKQPKQSARANHQDRGLQEMWRNPARVTKNTTLVPQGESSTAAQSQDEMKNTELSEAAVEDDFRARLRQAGEQLDNQDTHCVMARQVPSPDGHSPARTSTGWTTVNNAPSPGPRPLAAQHPAKRRHTTKSRGTKSSRLPLERVPDGCEVYHLVQRLSLSPAKLETSLYSFDSITGSDISWDIAAADFEHIDCRTKLSEGTAPCLGLSAISMLKQKLYIAVQSAGEDAALAFVGTFARLGGASGVDNHA